MGVRTFKAKDYPEVKRLLKEVEMFDPIWDSKMNLLGKVEKDNNSVLVYEEKDEVVGFVIRVRYGPELQYLFRLGVRKDFQGKGVGTKLLDHCKELARKEGVKEVGLYAEVDNDRLSEFYEKRGFKRSKKSYYYFWTEIGDQNK